MILPNKCLHINNTYLAAGAKLIELLDKPCTISSLWERVKHMKEMDNYERFISVIVFLRVLGAIDNEHGIIRRKHHDFES